MNNFQRITAIALMLSWVSCQQQNNQNTEQASATDALSSGSYSSAAAVVNGNDTLRKFIRTADLKFKVADVITTTYVIEDIAIRNKGFVTSSTLNNNIAAFSTTEISMDSTLETTRFTTANTMAIRVPDTLLDATLKEIGKSITYLDYRIIKADDVSLQILANNMARQRLRTSENRLEKTIEKTGKKLSETSLAEEQLLDKIEKSDAKNVSNLVLNDQINFSTIHLSIYQRESVKMEMVFNADNSNKYALGFGLKLKESFMQGWDIFSAFLISLTRLWALFLFFGLLYAGYRTFIALRKKDFSR